MCVFKAHVQPPAPHLSKLTVPSSVKGERHTPQDGEPILLIARLCRNKLRVMMLSPWTI